MTGFDHRPARSPLVTVILVAVVTTAAAAVAHGFRHTAFWVIEWIGGAEHSTDAAHRLAPLVVGGLVAATVLVARAGRTVAQRRWPDRAGIEAIAASTRGEDAPISGRATIVRTAATWLATVGLTSIGRESAIIESGGALGSGLGRRTGGKGDALAATGVAAAFAAAYHAPLAATLYVEEHLRVRQSWRGVRFALVGALGGHAVSLWLFDGQRIFPRVEGSHWRLLGYGAIALVPAALATRAFLVLRTGPADAGRIDRLPTRPRRLVVAILAVVAGGAVAIMPWAAGNGMEALRASATDVTAALVVALAVGKLVGTLAALAAGVPGGVLSPSLAVGAGWALIGMAVLDAAGPGVRDPWGLVVAAMVVAVAVGLRAPLMAPVLIAEMTGDYAVLPALAVVAAAAFGFDRLVDLGISRPTRSRLEQVHDEDA